MITNKKLALGIVRLILIILMLLLICLCAYHHHERNKVYYFTDFVDINNVVKISFVNGRIDDGYRLAYIFEGDKLDEVLDICAGITITRFINREAMKRYGFIGKEKYMYIYYADGSQAKLTFMGDGSSRFKISEDKYAALDYNGLQFGRYCQYYSDTDPVYVDKNANYVKDLEKVELFPESMMQPWAGY